MGIIKLINVVSVICLFTPYFQIPLFKLQVDNNFLKKDILTEAINSIYMLITSFCHDFENFLVWDKGKIKITCLCLQIMVCHRMTVK